jgi:hypothetical protein
MATINNLPPFPPGLKNRGFANSKEVPSDAEIEICIEPILKAPDLKIEGYRKENKRVLVYVALDSFEKYLLIFELKENTIIKVKMEYRDSHQIKKNTDITPLYQKVLDAIYPALDTFFQPKIHNQPSYMATIPDFLLSPTLRKEEGRLGKEFKFFDHLISFESFKSTF